MAYLFLVRRMRDLNLFDPVPAPHRTKRFWLFVALGIVPILCAPLYMILIDFRPFSFRVQTQSGIITLAMWSAFWWMGLRFGRAGWFAVAMLMFGLVIFAWLHG